MICDSAHKAVSEAWPILRFDQFAESIVERVDPAEADADIYVGLEHLDPESLKIRRWGTPDDVKGEKLRFREGDIIFGRRRFYQRKLAVAEFDGICSAHAMVLRAREGVMLQSFLPFFLQSETFYQRAMQISVGSLLPTINWRALAQQEFALPPLDEQRRIGEILWAADSSMGDWELCISRARDLQRIALSELVLKGIGHTEFKSSPVGQIPSAWQVARIGKLGEVQLGRQRAPQYQSGKHSRPYLRVANVFDGYLDLSDVLEMDFDDQDFERFALKDGDILLNEGQSRELVGRSCIYRDEIEGCCFQNTLVRFRASEKLLPEYAHGYFRLAFYSGVFARVARQTTSIAHLGAGRFAELPMPVPPVVEQRRIVNRLEVLNEAVCGLEQHHDTLSSLKRKLIGELIG